MSLSFLEKLVCNRAQLLKRNLAPKPTTPLKKKLSRYPLSGARREEFGGRGRLLRKQLPPGQRHRPRQRMAPGSRPETIASSKRYVVGTAGLHHLLLRHVFSSFLQRGLPRPALSNFQEGFVEIGCHGLVPQRDRGARGAQQAVETSRIQTHRAFVCG